LHYPILTVFNNYNVIDDILSRYMLNSDKITKSGVETKNSLTLQWRNSAWSSSSNDAEMVIEK